MPDLQTNSPAIGQKDGEKWTAAVALQPTFPKSDRLLAASQPLLLAEHAVADAGLVSEELASRSARLKRRLAFQFGGVACLLAVLAGVALLLWVALPQAGFRAPWLLLLTPAVPAALGLWALWLAQERETREPFASLRLQLAQDAALLRSQGAP